MANILSGSFHHQKKIVRKTLISTVFWLLWDFLPVFQISIRTRIWICMFLGLPDPHPDLLDRGTDPRIRICIQIRTKMSRIRNTVLYIGHKRKFYLNATVFVHEQVNSSVNIQAQDILWMRPLFWNKWIININKNKMVSKFPTTKLILLNSFTSAMRENCCHFIFICIVIDNIVFVCPTVIWSIGTVPLYIAEYEFFSFFSETGAIGNTRPWIIKIRGLGPGPSSDSGSGDPTETRSILDPKPKHRHKLDLFSLLHGICTVWVNISTGS